MKDRIPKPNPGIDDRVWSCMQAVKVGIPVWMWRRHQEILEKQKEVKQ